jgi:competence protein ComEA
LFKHVHWLALFSALLVWPAGAAELPDGPGKEIILRSCTGCHKPDAMSGYSHTPDEWQTIVDRMGDRAGLTDKSDLETLTTYLTKHFPKIVDPNKVNVNKATAKELVARLELTEKEAAAIVEYRDKHGDFRVWGDLLAIYGVDGKKIQAVKDRLDF